MVDKTRLHELLDQAIVDCYGEEEEFMGVLYTLADNLNFPLQATVLGEVVEESAWTITRAACGVAFWPKSARMTRRIRSRCQS